MKIILYAFGLLILTGGITFTGLCHPFIGGGLLGIAYGYAYIIGGLS